MSFDERQGELVVKSRLLEARKKLQKKIDDFVDTSDNCQLSLNDIFFSWSEVDEIIQIIKDMGNQVPFGAIQTAKEKYNSSEFLKWVDIVLSNLK